MPYSVKTERLSSTRTICDHVDEPSRKCLLVDRQLQQTAVGGPVHSEMP
jgi:hypothetical protein